MTSQNLSLIGNTFPFFGNCFPYWASGMQSLRPVNRDLRSTQESSNASVGKLYSFDGMQDINGPKITTLTFGRVIFTTNPANVTADGPDIFSGLFAPDGTGHIDGVFTRSPLGAYPGAVNVSNSVSFGTAQVRVLASGLSIPIPVWALALVAGLVFGAAGFARRSW